MEGEGFHRFSVFPRVGAIVLAVILLIVSAATIGVVTNNENLESVRKSQFVSDEVSDLQILINGSLGAAGWLIFMAGGIVIAEIVFIIISIVNTQPTVKLIFGIIEILFSAGAIVCYLATGIASAVYASQWGKKPVLCAAADISLGTDDLCDSIPLTATNALEAGFSIIQVVIFGVIAAMVILCILKSRTQKT